MNPTKQVVKLKLENGYKREKVYGTFKRKMKNSADKF